MQDTYTADEFATCYSMRGYGRKKDALKWLRENCIETAIDADFEKCYYDMNPPMVIAHGRKYIAMRIDGVNQSAPQNQPNSNGESFNAQMMKAQRELDATERWIRRNMQDASE